MRHEHGKGRTQELRTRIAQEAARLIHEHGLRDYGQAKRKAAQRLGVGDEASLPRNAEIEQALHEHLRLFAGATQPQLLRQRREAAREAMRFLHRFQPRLVGAVLEGTADEHSAVCLHLYSDNPDEVALFLDEQGVPFDRQSRRLRLDRERQDEFPVYLFSAGDVPFDLTVLPADGVRQAPLDRIDERPMRRASLSQMDALLADGDAP